MKKILSAFFVVFAAWGLYAAMIIEQNFEDKTFFNTDANAQKAQVSNSRHPGGTWIGFRKDFTIAPVNFPGSSGEQSLQINRVTPGYDLSVFRTTDLPADREYTVSFRFKTGKTGKSNFSVQIHNSFAKTKIAEVQFVENNIVRVRHGKTVTIACRYTPETWQQLSVTIVPGSETMMLQLLSADGEVISKVDVPVEKYAPVNMLRFFNMPGMTEPALIDDVKVFCDDNTSVSGRENIALSSEISLTDNSGKKAVPRLKDGMYDGFNSVLSNDFPAVLDIAFPEGKYVSSVRIHSGYAEYKQYASGDLSVTAYKVEVFSTAAGQWREVAVVKNAPVAKTAGDDDSLRFSQADFPALEATGVRITLLDSSDTGKRNNGPAPCRAAILREVEVFGHERGKGSSGLLNTIQAEYRLPVYRKQQQANLHIVADKAVKNLKLEISFRDRNNGKVPAPAFQVTVNGGENVIPIDISKWENGEYRTLIKSKSSQIKGEFARLLRIDRVEASVVKEGGNWSGKVLLFPDLKNLSVHNGVEVKVNQPETHPLNKDFYSGKDWLIQIGSSMNFLPDGRLAMKFSEISRDWKKTQVRYAVTEVGKWDWQISETAPEGFSRGTSELVNYACNSISSYLPGQSAGKSDNFRWYDPEKDGKINVRQLMTIYTGYKPCDWGIMTAPPQTTWVVWKKDGKYLLISKKPLLADGVSSDEFESPDSTNDNFAGEWVSEDGSTFFYVRGRTLKRYEPFIARYDNLWMISRILTIFMTKDGVNWTRHYFALPDENDAPTMQHYGAGIYKVPRGNGLLIAIQMDYSALHQQYDLEIVYSRDGICWERLADRTRWIPAAEPGGWNFGLTNMHNNILERDGMIYHQIGWASSHPHYSHEVTYFIGAENNITGEVMRKKFDRRGMTKWPYFKDFGSYDSLAQFMRDGGTTCGVVVYRKNGWFGLCAEKQGSFTTLKLRANGKLSANFKTAADGFIKLELLNANGEILAAKTLTGDKVEEVVFETLPDGEFQIRAEMDKATLYALDFK